MRITQTIKNARKEYYAVGSFSPRYLMMYGPVLQAGQDMRSPLIVQASKSEIQRFLSTPEMIAREYFTQYKKRSVTVPSTLHLDHCKDFDFICECIGAGFESVMIDASEYPLEKNIELTAKVVEYAHAHGVDVEGELGRIASNDNIETDISDAEHYTNPREAMRFVKETGVDLLAISVGTAHGVYTVKAPYIDTKRIVEIRDLCGIPLVLHGASGVPADMLHGAFEMEGGGVSKVNIATDLEHAFLKTIGSDKPLTNVSVKDYPIEMLEAGQKAVYNKVCEKMRDFLHSFGRA